MAKLDPGNLRVLIQTFIRRFGLLDQTRTPCGLPITVSDAHTLMELLQNPDFDQMELSRKLGLSKSAMSRLLQRLKRRGQISRSRSKVDGRAYSLKLTKKGKRQAEMINRESLATFKSIISGISEDVARQLLECFPFLIKALPEPRRYLNSAHIRHKHCGIKGE